MPVGEFSKKITKYDVVRLLKSPIFGHAHTKFGLLYISAQVLTEAFNKHTIQMFHRKRGVTIKCEWFSSKHLYN
jgi:hypothetical protein